MFKYTNTETGETMTIENPRYVKKDERGIWIRCEEADAECIAINGERFSIGGKNPVDDAPQVIAISKIDLGEHLKTFANAQDIDEVKAAIEDIADAVLDIYLNDV